MTPLADKEVNLFNMFSIRRGRIEIRISNSYVIGKLWQNVSCQVPKRSLLRGGYFGSSRNLSLGRKD